MKALKKQELMKVCGGDQPVYMGYMFNSNVFVYRVADYGKEGADVFHFGDPGRNDSMNVFNPNLFLSITNGDGVTAGPYHI